MPNPTVPAPIMIPKKDRRPARTTEMVVFSWYYLRAVWRGCFHTVEQAHASVPENHAVTELGISTVAECWPLSRHGRKPWRTSHVEGRTLFVSPPSDEEVQPERDMTAELARLHAATACPTCGGGNIYQGRSGKKGCHDCDDNAMLAALAPECPECQCAEVEPIYPGENRLECRRCGFRWNPCVVDDEDPGEA